MNAQDSSPNVFRVWAPTAREVSVLVNGVEFALQKAPEQEWWTGGPLEDLSSGSGDDVDYGFIVDGEGPFPDPRSRRQPAGVHALSRTYRASDFEWTDNHWTGMPVQGRVIYELHVGTFTPQGTLDAAVPKLPYLRALGVNFVELLPVNAFNGIHNWGYDGVLWFAVHEPYGGPEAYQRFVDACHNEGLGVIQDVVYNHLGPSGNYLPKFGPYLSHDSATTWGATVNLDGADSDEVRRYIIDNALMWLGEYHVDGLRLDAVHAFVDTRAITLLEELAVEVAELSLHVARPLSLIAESDQNNPKLTTSRQAGGIGLDAQWSDDFHHSLHVVLTGEVTGYYADFEGLSSLATTLTAGFFHAGTYSSFRQRHHGRPIDTLTTPSTALVVFNQDHDQIGNRAQGDRLAATLDDGQLAIAATLTLLGTGTPMIFMGEEWAASTPWQYFTSHPERELGEATARGRIAEFARMGWDESLVPDPQDPQTFERSKLRWGEAESGRHRRMIAFYRALMRLRLERADLTDSRFATAEVHVIADGTALILQRAHTVIIANFSGETVLLSQFGAKTVAAADVLLAFGEHSLEDSGLSLSGHAVAVIRHSRGDCIHDRTR